MKVSVSFIKSLYNEKQTIDLINNTSADYLHVDITDGIFVENKNYDYEDIKQFLLTNKKPLDIHLMCHNPSDYIYDYVKLKPNNITFHIETVRNPLRLIEYIHQKGIKCGIAINPETPVKTIIPYINMIDRILIMSVHPGKGGQKFMMECLDKINELSRLKGHFEIEIDGGINSETINLVKQVDIVVAGSFICMNEDFEKQISKLK